MIWGRIRQNSNSSGTLNLLARSAVKPLASSTDYCFAM